MNARVRGRPLDFGQATWLLRVLLMNTALGMYLPSYSHLMENLHPLVNTVEPYISIVRRSAFLHLLVVGKYLLAAVGMVHSLPFLYYLHRLLC